MINFAYMCLIISTFFACSPKAPTTKNAARPSNASTSSTPTSETGVYSVTQQLIAKQSVEFPRILKELQKNKKKTSHWIWWVFPTERSGENEPEPKTRVELASLDYLLSNADLNAWAQILEEIFNLLKEQPLGEWHESGNKPNPKIIPSVDHGRIRYALDFWLKTAAEKTKKYPRFFNAFKNLAKFNWE